MRSARQLLGSTSGSIRSATLQCLRVALKTPAIASELCLHGFPVVISGSFELPANEYDSEKNQALMVCATQSIHGMMMLILWCNSSCGRLS